MGSTGVWCATACTALAVSLMARSAALAQSPSPHIPTPAHKQTPVVVAFGSCGPDGKAGDPDENHLKNRTDTATTYTAVTFGAFRELLDPTTLQDSSRARWPHTLLQQIEKPEGVPVSLTGFLAQVTNADGLKHGARPEGAEATNCRLTTPTKVDWHLWVLPSADSLRRVSVVAEITPRLRAKHAGWTLAKLDRIAHDRIPVRVSGWTLFDPEHPDQLGQTRGTLWEIHPITRIEVQSNGHWQALEAWQPPGSTHKDD